MEAGAVALAALVVGVVYPIIRVVPPYTMEDVHPIMAGLAADRANAPAIFLHYSAAPAFEYYASRYGFEAGSYSVASCQVETPSDALREVDSLRAQPRAWIVFVHVTPGLALERADLLAYLDTIGYRRDSIVLPSHRAVGGPIPSEAFLFDLSDPIRLAKATADRFPLRATFHRGASCLEGPQTMSVPKRAMNR
jgi:hypothetical protein